MRISTAFLTRRTTPAVVAAVLVGLLAGTVRGVVLDEIITVRERIRDARTAAPDRPFEIAAYEGSDAAAVNRELVRFADGTNVLWRGGPVTEATGPFKGSRPATYFGAGRCSWWKDPEMWYDLVRGHRQSILTGPKEYDLVFLGDSITHHWTTDGKRVLAELSARMRVLVLGVPGDAVEHALWRAKYGEMDGFRAKVIVVMIGTNNNYAGDSAPSTVSGVQALVAEIRRRHPESLVVLNAIFPRGATAADPMRRRNEAVNRMIRELADGKHVVWMDFNSRLMAADGTLSKSLFYDYVHPGEVGYRIWAEELEPLWGKR